jgi:hypothetical protein
MEYTLCDTVFISFVCSRVLAVTAAKAKIAKQRQLKDGGGWGKQMTLSAFLSFPKSKMTIVNALTFSHSGSLTFGLCTCICKKYFLIS